MMWMKVERRRRAMLLNLTASPKAWSAPAEATLPSFSGQLWPWH